MSLGNYKESMEMCAELAAHIELHEDKIFLCKKLWARRQIFTQTATGTCPLVVRVLDPAQICHDVHQTEAIHQLLPILA